MLKIKKVFATLLIIFSMDCYSKGTVKLLWFGTTNILISDNDTTIAFDPFFTRPSIWDIVFLKGLNSDPELIKKYVHKKKLNKIKGIFTSHTHYDHVLDLNSLQQLTKAKVFGSSSTKFILNSSLKRDKFQQIKAGDIISIGDFKITIMPSSHPPHLLGVTLLDGNIEEPISKGSNVLQYKKGTSFSFYIEHPSGKLLFHPSATKSLKADFGHIKNIDTLILGIANRVSTEDQINSIISKVTPKTIIPVHHDDFFKPLDQGYTEGKFSDTKEFTIKALDFKKNTKILKLKYGQSTPLR
tara:strand:+ start:52945 stop:53838 length:894 start_codon:yes stop_codon:yes gene_type:complete